jgi:hypothetical protein
MEEPQGIYRGEVYAIMGVLSDIDVNVRRILRAVGGGDDEEEEEDLPDA